MEAFERIIREREKKNNLKGKQRETENDSPKKGTVKESCKRDLNQKRKGLLHICNDRARNKRRLYTGRVKRAADSIIRAQGPIYRCIIKIRV